MDTAGERKVSDDKATAPVDTGLYRNEIELQPAKKTSAGWEAAILYGAPYSRAVQARNPHHLPSLRRLPRDVKAEAERRLEAAQR